LHDVGYIEGQNLVLERRNADEVKRGLYVDGARARSSRNSWGVR